MSTTTTYSPYPCPYCSEGYPSYEKRERHIGTFHPEKMEKGIVA